MHEDTLDETADAATCPCCGAPYLPGMIEPGAVCDDCGAARRGDWKVGA